jgi:hypothetical protein
MIDINTSQKKFWGEITISDSSREKTGLFTDLADAKFGAVQHEGGCRTDVIDTLLWITREYR